MTRESLEILTFHRILPQGKRYFIPPMALDARTFSALIERLAAAGRIVSLTDGVRQLAAGQLSGRKVAITFDDGYRDNFDLARDILRRIGTPATFFIPVGPIDEQRPYWWDTLHGVATRYADEFFSWVAKREFSGPLMARPIFAGGSTVDHLDDHCRNLVRVLNGVGDLERQSFLADLVRTFGDGQEERLLMNWDEIRRLQDDGFDIGSHALSHIPLTDLDEESACREIDLSADHLFQRLGRRPEGFCYPRGAHNEIHARMVEQSGYAYAVTTCFGSNENPADLFTLKRRNMADYHGVRAYFPVAMYLFELSGRLDSFLSSRRNG